MADILLNDKAKLILEMVPRCSTTYRLSQATALSVDEVEKYLQILMDDLVVRDRYGYRRTALGDEWMRNASRQFKMWTSLA